MSLRSFVGNCNSFQTDNRACDLGCTSVGKCEMGTLVGLPFENCPHLHLGLVDRTRLEHEAASLAHLELVSITECLLGTRRHFVAVAKSYKLTADWNVGDNHIAVILVAAHFVRNDLMLAIGRR